VSGIYILKTGATGHLGFYNTKDYLQFWKEKKATLLDTTIN
jgi:thioester reductase-like protein